MKEIILFLCVLWIGSSMAKSFRPTSYDYDYREYSRKASNNYRVRSATTTTPRPSLQQYWDSFVSNIPTLPPLPRWNMTNSFTNLFNNGAQEIMETPVSMHQMMEEPNRRRKSSRRKVTTKKNKNRKRAQPRDQSTYYNYATPTYQQQPIVVTNGGYQQNSGYQQIQLQPLGTDQSNIMHFYEPKTGSYYALQMLSPQNTNTNYNYNSGSNSNTNYYNNHENYSYNNEDDNDDDEDDDDYYYHNRGHGVKEHKHGHHYDTENDNYDNEYNYDGDHETEGGVSDYADDVVLADNWGYTDDEVFGDRKLKGNLMLIKPTKEEMDSSENENDMANNIVKIQKNLLKPESLDDVMFLLSNNGVKPSPMKETNEQKPNNNRVKPSPIKETNDEKPSVRRLKPTPTKESEEDLEAESVRNLLGSFMKDDRTNRRRQSANTKQSSRLVETPRQKEGYYLFPANFWV